MTLAQTRALAPLLSRIGEALRVYHLLAEDLDHSSPAVYLTVREWQRLLEEFGTP